VTFARIGSVMYVAWGLLHIQAAVSEMALGAGLEPGLIQGKLRQGAWDLLFFALFAIVVALRLNWRNRPLGYWANLIVVSAADLGFIIFVLIPGYVPLFPGLLGPIFWIAGLAFTTLGFRDQASVLSTG